MTDPTGGSIAHITTDMLKRVAMAKSPQQVAQVVRQIAATLGTGTGPVIRGIATAMGSSSAAMASWAATATNAVQGAMNAGALAASETVVTGAAAGAAGAAGGGAAASGGGMFAWFTGASLATQVAVVIGAVVLTSVVAQGVGTLAGDDPTAIPGEGPITTLESGPTLPTFSDGYQAIGVRRGGEISIVSVRGTTAIEEGIPPCRFRHGGTNCDDPADIVELDPTVYATEDEATEALCEMLDGPYYSPALADGWSVEMDGDVVTLDDWGEVQFDVCREVLGMEDG